jgi:Flp pilus assembly pilin Flp
MNFTDETKCCCLAGPSRQLAQGLTEYGLILSLASLVAVVAVTTFGGNVASSIANALGTVISTFPAP